MNRKLMLAAIAMLLITGIITLLVVTHKAAPTNVEEHPPVSPDPIHTPESSDPQPQTSESKGPPSGVFPKIAVNTQPEWVERSGAYGWVQTINPGNHTDQFSLQLRVQVPLKGEHLSIVVTDKNGSVEPVLGNEFELPSDIALHSLIQSPVYPMGSDITVKVAILGMDRRTDTPPVRVESVVAERSRSEIQPEGVSPHWDPVRGGLPEVQSSSESLARLRIGDNYCSGFAISNDLLLTNHHCIESVLQPDQDICLVTSIVFGYISDEPGRNGRPAKCVKILASDANLDYLIIRFAPYDTGAVIQPLPVAHFPEDAKSNEITIVHHPRGQVAQYSQCTGPPKPIDMETPTKRKVSDQRVDCGLGAGFLVPTQQQQTHTVTYACDTAPGSSGSPVIVRGAAVALHFSWDYRYYDSEGNLGDYDSVSCLVDHLKLGNWGKDICTVLSDAASNHKGEGIPSCN